MAKPSVHIAIPLFLAATLSACNATKMNTWQLPPNLTAAQAIAENEECRQRTDAEHPEFGPADALPYIGVMFSLHRGDVRERFFLDCMRSKGYRLIAVNGRSVPTVASDAPMVVRATCQRAVAWDVRALNLPVEAAGEEYDRRLNACLAEKGY